MHVAYMTMLNLCVLKSLTKASNPNFCLQNEKLFKERFCRFGTQHSRIGIYSSYTTNLALSTNLSEMAIYKNQHVCIVYTTGFHSRFLFGS